MDEEERPQFSMVQTPEMVAEKASIVEMQLEVESLVLAKKMDLLGLRYNRRTKELENNPGTRAIIGIEGANRILSDFRTNMEHPATLGYLMAVEARDFAREYETDLAEQIAINSTEWKVEKINDMDSFIASTGRLVFCNYTRAVQGKTHKGIVTMTQLREVHSQAVTEREVAKHKVGWRDKVRNALGGYYNG